MDRFFDFTSSLHHLCMCIHNSLRTSILAIFFFCCCYYYFFLVYVTPFSGCWLLRWIRFVEFGVCIYSLLVCWIVISSIHFHRYITVESLTLSIEYWWMCISGLTFCVCVSILWLSWFHVSVCIWMIQFGNERWHGNHLTLSFEPQMIAMVKCLICAHAYALTLILWAKNRFGSLIYKNKNIFFLYSNAAMESTLRITLFSIQRFVRSVYSLYYFLSFFLLFLFISPSSYI